MHNWRRRKPHAGNHLMRKLNTSNPPLEIHRAKSTIFRLTSSDKYVRCKTKRKNLKNALKRILRGESLSAWIGNASTAQYSRKKIPSSKKITSYELFISTKPITGISMISAVTLPLTLLTGKKCSQGRPRGQKEMNSLI